jgi:hypothetical protein
MIFHPLGYGRPSLPSYLTSLRPRDERQRWFEDIHTNHAGFDLGSGTILVDQVDEELGSDGELTPGVAEE